MTDRRLPPVLIDLDAEAAAQPDAAPPVPDAPVLSRPAAMQQAAALAARRGRGLGTWALGLGASLLAFVASVAAWDWITGLLTRAPLLGWAALALLVAFLGVLLIAALRELAAFHRLARLDRLQRAAAEVLVSGSLPQARALVGALTALYTDRPDTGFGRQRLAERQGDILDADGLLGLAETDLLAPLDAQAQREIEAAARQVATVTAVVPLAFADVVAALTANAGMIRRIAEIYGGRGGVLGSWRLTRTVLTHLVATGAVAVGDDLISSVAGGSVLSKLSRRFGEGVVNGALTARVGVAAMEVCRPLPFRVEPAPRVTTILRRALAGLFGQRD